MSEKEMSEKEMSDQEMSDKDFLKNLSILCLVDPNLKIAANDLGSIEQISQLYQIIQDPEKATIGIVQNIQKHLSDNMDYLNEIIAEENKKNKEYNISPITIENIKSLSEILKVSENKDNNKKPPFKFRGGFGPDDAIAFGLAMFPIYSLGINNTFQTVHKNEKKFREDNCSNVSTGVTPFIESNTILSFISNRKFNTITAHYNGYPFTERKKNDIQYDHSNLMYYLEQIYSRNKDTNEYTVKVNFVDAILPKCRRRVFNFNRFIYKIKKLYPLYKKFKSPIKALESGPPGNSNQKNQKKIDTIQKLEEIFEGINPIFPKDMTYENYPGSIEIHYKNDNVDYNYAFFHEYAFNAVNENKNFRFRRFDEFVNEKNDKISEEVAVNMCVQFGKMIRKIKSLRYYHIGNYGVKLGPKTTGSPYRYYPVDLFHYNTNNLQEEEKYTIDHVKMAIGYALSTINLNEKEIKSSRPNHLIKEAKENIKAFAATSKSDVNQEELANVIKYIERLGADNADTVNVNVKDEPTEIYQKYLNKNEVVYKANEFECYMFSIIYDYICQNKDIIGDYWNLFIPILEALDNKDTYIINLKKEHNIEYNYENTELVTHVTKVINSQCIMRNHYAVLMTEKISTTGIGILTTFIKTSNNSIDTYSPFLDNAHKHLFIWNKEQNNTLTNVAYHGWDRILTSTTIVTKIIVATFGCIISSFKNGGHLWMAILQTITSINNGGKRKSKSRKARRKSRKGRETRRRQRKSKRT